MAAVRKRKRYKFKPNKNTVLVLILIVMIVWIIAGLSSCMNRHDKSLRGADYEYAPVLLPEYQVRNCARPDGTPSADYFEIYPPEAGDKVVYLTFDDGPSAKVTPQILDILKQYNVKATFFVIAKNAEQYPDTVKRAAEEGHTIASHTYSHDYSYVYGSTENFKEELNKAKEVLTNIVGEDGFTNIFRFPGGAFREQRAEFKEVLIEENIPFVNWNCLTGDAETRSPVPADLIAKAKKSAASAGSDSLVVLMHDAGAKQATADALPGLIEYFQGEGYRFEAIQRY